MPSRGPRFRGRLVRIEAELPAPLIDFLVDFSERIAEAEDGTPDIGIGLIEVLMDAQDRSAEFWLFNLPELPGIH